jgi:hypothetical protein
VHTRLRRFFLLPVVVVAVLVGACDSTVAALPRLDDPDEVLEEALRTTAELEFVHARLDMSATAPEAGGMVVEYTIDADIDLGSREFRAIAEAGMGIGGSQRIELLLVGTELFSRFEAPEGFENPVPDGKWQRMGMGAGQDPRAGLPPNPAIAVALRVLLEDASLETGLLGMESCGDLQCYRIRATVAPDLIWRAMNGALFGAPPDTEIPPVDPSIPPVTLELMIEESTRRLVSVATSITHEGSTVNLAASFSNHDVEVQFLAPPPDQIDDNTGGFGQGQILEDIGSEVLGGGPGD